MNNSHLAKYSGKKIHGLQLSDIQKNILRNRLQVIDDWGISEHTIDRLVQKGIVVNYDDIVKTIDKGEIIEYKIDPKESTYVERVVVRSKKSYNKNNIVAVFDLTREKIITVWANHVDDVHDTLNLRVYDRNMKVFKD